MTSHAPPTCSPFRPLTSDGACEEGRRRGTVTDMYLTPDARRIRALATALDGLGHASLAAFVRSVADEVEGERPHVAT